MALADLRELAQLIREANRGAVARGLNLLEDLRAEARPAAAVLLDELAGLCSPGEGHRVGLTGPPGVGKSSLASALVRHWRAHGRSVGILAVDPSSQRSGGALLGDRARMAMDDTDSGVFMRSFATSGEAGGLCLAVPPCARLLGAAFDIVLVETTGVGQTEADVAMVADTVVLAVQPGSGDTLQFLKAGITEIPDLFVVNKADQGAAAQRTAADLGAAINVSRSAGDGGETPVVMTSCRDGSGIDALAQALKEHAAALSTAGRQARRRAGDRAWAEHLAVREYGQHGVSTLGGTRGLRAGIELLLRAGKSPVAAVADLGVRYIELIRHS